MTYRTTKLLKTIQIPNRFGDPDQNQIFEKGTIVDVTSHRSPLERRALVNIHGKPETWEWTFTIDTNLLEPVGEWYWDPKNKRNIIPTNEIVLGADLKQIDESLRRMPNYEQTHSRFKILD